MKEFLGEDFLLDSPLALELYNKAAKNAPIFDFHCHLSPEEIYNDKHFETITEAWLGKDGQGDHYKWRLLREFGVNEEFITGNASDYERFYKFAEAMPSFIGNPIYEWAHLELKRFFGINEPLNASNAKKVYEICNEKLKTLSAREMLKQMNVKIVFTTDDLVDDLRFHELMAKDKSMPFDVLPCIRPDGVLKIDADNFAEYIAKLSSVVGYKIDSIKKLEQAVSERLDFLAAHGCRASDHDIVFTNFIKKDADSVDLILKKRLNGGNLSFEELVIYRSYLLVFLGKEYAKRGRVNQYHIGVLRNANSRLFKLLGRDSGIDCGNDNQVLEGLANLMSELEETNSLPRTIIYVINEKDYGAVATMINSFNDGSIKGKVQLGSAWWFNDHYDGMTRQLKTLGNYGLLSCFVGMVTDSRSFLSYVRHEYFRRTLCNVIAGYVEAGRYPNDKEKLLQIVEDVCYNNSYDYFFKR
ncbi:MAG: glucuronate isomerase [Bacilli bacterium]|nr:glucuronate isomerase [Bacilli bacterium]